MSARIAVDRFAVADQVEIPERIRGIADQHRAGEPAVGDDELLVDAAPAIGQHDGSRCRRRP